MIKHTIMLAAAAAALAAVAEPVSTHGTPVSARTLNRPPIRVRLDRKADTHKRLLSAAGTEDVATSLLAQWGVKNREEELKERKRETDRYGRTHIRYRQFYRGIEVDARELIVHEKDGEVYEVNGEFLAGLTLDTEPTRQVAGGTLVVWCKDFRAKSARLAWRVNRMVKGRRYWDFIDDKTGEVLQSRRAGAAIKATNDDPETPGDDDEDDEDEKEDEFIKEINTAVLEREAVDKPYPEGSPVSITGRLPWQMGADEVTVVGIESDGKKYLTCTNSYGVEYCVYNGFCAPCYTNDLSEIETEEELKEWFRDFTNKVNFTAYDNYDPNSIEAKDALAIAYNIGQVLDWYKEAFDRDSYNGKTRHEGRVACWQFWNEATKDILTGYNNAYWYSASSNNGDDDAVGNFYFGYNYAGEKTLITFDTCAHELTHGVTESTANLQYEGEPGALNESFSDIMAAACEFAKQPEADNPEEPKPGEADWLMAEDCTGNYKEAFRSFADPSGLPVGIDNEDARQPSRYCGSNWRDTSPSASDNGGVHGNSGVQNHFFYLLCEGSKGWNGEKDAENDGIPYDEFEGIGVENAAKIAYQVLTAYCGPRTDYRQVSEYWLDAAIDMIEEDYPNGEPWSEDDIAVTNAVVKAWAAVMPFEELNVGLDGILEGVEAGVQVTVVGLAKWDGETDKTVMTDGEYNYISIWIPKDFDTMASSLFRIENRMLYALNLGSEVTVQDLGNVSNPPESSSDIRITDVKIDADEMLIVAEVKNGDQKACVNDFSPTISDLLRLRRSDTPDFTEAEDLDIVKYKNPFADDEGNVVENKYNIIFKLPKDATSGFYRLEW